MGLWHRGGACPPESSRPPALQLPGNELVASAHWWVATQVASSPGACLPFRPSADGVWGKVVGVASTVTWQEDVLSFLPGLDGGHFTACQEKSVSQIPMNFVLFGGNHFFYFE